MSSHLAVFYGIGISCHGSQSCWWWCQCLTLLAKRDCEAQLVAVPTVLGQNSVEGSFWVVFCWRIYSLTLHLHLRYHHFTLLEQRLGYKYFYDKFSQVSFTHKHTPFWPLLLSGKGSDRWKTVLWVSSVHHCFEEFSIASFITGCYWGSHYSQVLSKDSELKRHEYLFASCSDVASCDLRALKALPASFVAWWAWFYSKFKHHCWYELDTNSRSRLFKTCPGALEC